MSIRKNPSVDLPGSSPERRAFYFFSNQTGAALTQGFVSNIWSRLVLQTSHFDPVVKTIATAMGALNERFQINDVSTTDNEQANALHEFAMIQYTKAAARLRHQIGNEAQHDIELTLIACLMFVLFDFIQGDDERSMLHLRTGLALLHQHIDQLPNGSTIMFDMQTRLGLISLLFALFGRAGCLWVSIPPIRHKILTTFDVKLYSDPVGTAMCITPPRTPSADEIYSSLDDADDTMRRNLIATLFFGQKATAQESYDEWDSVPSSIPCEMVVEQEQLLERLHRWPRAMQILLDKIHPQLSKKDEYRATNLQIQHRATFLLLIAALAPQQKAAIHSRYTHVFEEIVNLTESLRSADWPVVREVICPPPPDGPLGSQGIAMFVFRPGLVQPLHYVAKYCTDQSLARKALEMLETRPWREGGWDSAAMAKIARKGVHYTW